MIRIAQMIDTLKVGGAEKLQVTFANAVRSRDVDLTVICLREGQTVFRDELEAMGVSIVTFPGPTLFHLPRLWKLFQYLRRERFDVIHAHLTMANILSSLLGRLIGIPVVTTIHSTAVRRDVDHPMLAPVESWALSYASREVIAVGYAVAEAHKHRVKSKTIHVIPNAVPSIPGLSEQEIKTLRTQIAGDADRLILFSAGRLLPPKGYGDLLTAVNMLREKYPSIMLAIAGDGKIREQLEAQINDLKLEGNAVLLGMRSDVQKLLLSSDLYVSSSHWEGMPVSILEAMAVGLPIVATGVGDVPKVVLDGMGIIVPPYEPQKLAEAIQVMLDAPDKRRAYGAAGKAYVLKTFSTSAWVDQVFEVYEKAMKRPVNAPEKDTKKLESQGE